MPQGTQRPGRPAGRPLRGAGLLEKAKDGGGNYTLASLIFILRADPLGFRLTRTTPGGIRPPGAELMDRLQRCKIGQRALHAFQGIASVFASNFRHWWPAYTMTPGAFVP